MISEATINLGVVGATCLLLVIYFIKFVYSYKHQYESNPLCTFSVMFCLLVVLLVTFILPIDIFLVSFAKNHDGTFKDWATNETLSKVDKFMYDTYYSLYGLSITLMFIVIPFLHFFNDETDSSSSGRLHTAIKITFGATLFMIALIFAGSYTYSQNLGPNDIFKNILPYQKEDKIQNGIVFVLTLITTMGFVNVCFYTASGIFSWPIGLLLGTKEIKSRYNIVNDRADLLRLQVSNLRQKSRAEGLSDREQEKLTSAEAELAQLDHEATVLSEQSSSWSHKLRIIIRPVQILFGAIFVILSIILLITLITVDVDRILHSNGPKEGYVLLKPVLPNALEYVFTKTQDLILIGPIPLLIIVCFLAVATISGIRNLGLWFLLTRLYRVKPGRTPPRALLFFCITVMLTALAFNLLLYSMASQYITFGNQNYVAKSANGTMSVQPCTVADYNKDCLLTRSSVILMRMMSNLWLFGAMFYWSSWIFVAIGTVSFIAYLYRGRRQAAHDLILDDDDFED